MEVFMCKKAKFILLIGTVLLCLLLVNSCKQEPEDDPQISINLTGLNSYAGKYAVIGLASSVTGVTVAMSKPAYIPGNGNVSTYLLSAIDGVSKFTSKGDFIVVLLIGTENASTIYWSGGIPSVVSINSDSITLPFSRFINIPYSMHLSESLRGIIDDLGPVYE
jgi:hypothetical protein